LVKMGTAGSLTLLDQIPKAPFFVINGDLLTNVNFRQLLDFHITSNCLATMSVKHYPVELPYGVIKVENHNVIGLEEKPLYNFLINAGIYVLNPEFLEFVPKGIYSNMTTIISDSIAQGQKISCFPIWEHWFDIGRHEDFIKASGQFGQIFS